MKENGASLLITENRLKYFYRIVENKNYWNKKVSWNWALQELDFKLTHNSLLSLINIFSVFREIDTHNK